MEGSNPTTETECSISLADNPSQMQDVTLDHDGTFSNTMGLRSPGGPLRGRSVKEFEEQLTNLKKENFNLKLRIYFLEEKMGTNFTLDKDNIVKKYIELQVDFANLKREMEEKQELLCQAVKAMELEDEEHKKYLSEKEKQIVTYQQEIEDLRVQLQDVKSDYEGTSTKSDTTGLSSGRLCGALVTELQDKVKFLENELHLEKETNASYQLIMDQTETLKVRYESLLSENQAKEESIRKLRQENELSNSRILNFTEQIKNFQDKLNLIYQENQSINKRLKEENKRFDELSEHYQELKKKYSNVKTELEREHQKSERVKYAGETRVSDLEGENNKLKHILRETQGKLETALTEIRKNQNLAVSKSLLLNSNTSNTDAACVSVQNTTTPTGTPKKDPLHVQIVSSTTSGALKSSSSVSVSSLSSSPDKFNNIDLEDLLATQGYDKILSVINSIKYEYETQRQKVFKLKAEQLKACEIIKNMIDSRNKANEEIQQYQVQVKNLERELESVVSKPTSDRDSPVSLRERVLRANENIMEESKSEDKKIAELYKDFTIELENKIEVLEATLQEKDKHIEKIRDQYDDLLNNLEKKEQKILQLETDLMSTSSGVSIDIPNSEKGDSASEKRSKFYKKIVEEKDQEISRLTAELKKCSCYLQEIVNKELWDKNKEIEKLHCRQVNSPEILKLRKDLTGKEQQLKLLKEKISELGLDMKIMHELDVKDLSSPTVLVKKSLQDELKAVKDERDYFKKRILELETTGNSEFVEKLKARADTLASDLQKSEHLRRESNEVCTLLSARLEELAVFLDTLLKQKSVLGFLGIYKERRLREIINNSLDLSKSLSLQLNPDESLTQLSNITAFLNGSGFKDLFQDYQDADESHEMLSIVPGNVTLTYQSHLYKQKNTSQMDNDEVLAALRSQIVNLKSELQLRDIELSRLNGNVKLSETDEEQRLNKYARELSKVTVTPNKNNTTSATLNYQSECASESEGWSEPDRVVSRARIGLSQSLPLSPTSKTIRLSESTDDDNLSVSALYRKRQEIEQTQEAIDIKAELERKTEQLNAAEQKLLNYVAKEAYEEVKNNLLEAEGRAIKQEMLNIEIENYAKVLKDEIDGLTKLQDELKRAFEDKDEQVQDLLNQLEAEKLRSQEITERLEEVVENSNKQRIAFECKEKEFKQLENQLQKDLLDISARLEEEKNKLQDMKTETVVKIKEIEDNFEHRIKEIKTYYNNKKTEVENKLGVLNKLMQDLDELKEMVKDYEQTIEVHKNKEVDYENRVCEYQEKVNSLRKELDATTLEYSDAVLQKNRLANEKTSLEQELSRCNNKELELRQQINEIRSEMSTVSQNYQQEVTLRQKQKSELQMKISLLESNNAELHNRLIRNQELSRDFSSPGANMRIETGGSYTRQFSQSSFNSEENLQECSRCSVNASLSRNRQPVDTERQEANASPDLGIESDQGRLSSLEIHSNITRRPLLQTLELTQSMNNMLDDNSVRNAMCDSHQCCQRTLEIAQENTDLKRKLLRMKRTLEETANQLNLANQRKKEVEKTICKQIHKTSQVLRKAKANLDSGSEM